MTKTNRIEKKKLKKRKKYPRMKKNTTKKELRTKEFLVRVPCVCGCMFFAVVCVAYTMTNAIDGYCIVCSAAVDNLYFKFATLHCVAI